MEVCGAVVGLGKLEGGVDVMKGGHWNRELLKPGGGDGGQDGVRAVVAFWAQELSALGLGGRKLGSFCGLPSNQYR